MASGWRGPPDMRISSWWPEGRKPEEYPTTYSSLYLISCWVLPTCWGPDSKEFVDESCPPRQGQGVEGWRVPWKSNGKLLAQSFSLLRLTEPHLPLLVSWERCYLPGGPALYLPTAPFRSLSSRMGSQPQASLRIQPSGNTWHPISESPNPCCLPSSFRAKSQHWGDPRLSLPHSGLIMHTLVHPLPWALRKQDSRPCASLNSFNSK